MNGTVKGVTGGDSADWCRGERVLALVPLRARWFSSRALLLHLAVLVVAPGCALAGWWQATRALAGNTLSWAYSVEWPLFALIAIAGWWHLIHEDPDEYRARKARPAAPDKVAPELPLPGTRPRVSRATAHHATRLALGLAAEFVLGMMALLSVPFNRPEGWLPPKGEIVYLAHSAWGFMIVLGATVLLVRAQRDTRTAKLVAWLGFAGVAVSGIGGLLTFDSSLVRFLGITLMFGGTAIAAFAYLIPRFLRSGDPRDNGVRGADMSVVG